MRLFCAASHKENNQIYAPEEKICAPWRPGRGLFCTPESGAWEGGLRQQQFPGDPAEEPLPSLNARHRGSGHSGSNVPSLHSLQWPKPVFTKCCVTTDILCPANHSAPADTKAVTVLTEGRGSSSQGRLSSVTSSGPLSSKRADMTCQRGKLRLQGFRRSLRSSEGWRWNSVRPRPVDHACGFLLNPGNDFVA